MTAKHLWKLMSSPFYAATVSQPVSEQKPQKPQMTSGSEPYSKLSGSVRLTTALPGGNCSFAKPQTDPIRLIHF